MSEPTEDLAMKVLQLECIIDAKDREIQILRQQASHDPEDLIKQLQDQNDALSSQLSKLRLPGNSQGEVATQAASGNLLHWEVKQAVIDAAQVMQSSSAALNQLLEVLQKAEEAPAVEVNGVHATVNAADAPDRLIQLNVGGIPMVAQLSVLQQVPHSRLAAMFAPQGSQQQQQRLLDADGRCYLPFEPGAFRNILSVLQARSVFGSSNSSSFCYLQPSAASSLHAAAAAAPPPVGGAFTVKEISDWEYMLQLVEYLGLQDLLPADVTAAASSSSSTGLLTSLQQQVGASSNGSSQKHANAAKAGGGSSGGKALKHSQPATHKQTLAHQAVIERTNDKSRTAAAEPAQAAANNAPAAAAAAAALHALPVRQASIGQLGVDSNSKAAAGSADATISEPAAAARAAAVQALLPKRSEGGQGSDPGDGAAAAAAAATSAAAALLGKLQLRTLSRE